MATNLKMEAQPLGLKALSRYSDIPLAMGVAAIVGMMIVPLPEILLDVFITVNISLGLVMLLVAMYTREPLEFSVFPSLLLIATLFRLALNISATKLILLQAHAGQVIASFGQFVVGGNYVVGIVVFLILVIIQFVVITSGAGRVAEVAARFTLDAMPGKQMAIDADLNAGIITDDEARRRRKSVEREADFYGAMDGASKFVKGDAIAGIVIIIINILGGFTIGALQLHMPLLQALQTYTILTVGDGLVSQIPALLISTATGIIVTRSASEANLGHDVGSQLLSNPRALGVVGGLLVLLALVPGLPKIPFLTIAAVLGGAAYVLRRGQQQEALKPAASPSAAASGVDTDEIARLLQVDPLEVEIGYGLIPLADAEQGGNLLGRITLIRRQVATELGIVLPTIRIRDNLELGANTYVFKLRGIQVAQGEVRINRYLAMNPGTAESDVDGLDTVEPAFGLPARWIVPEDKERAEMLGYTVVDPASVITTHLTEVIKTCAPELLGRQEVQSLLDGVKAESPAVLADLIPEQMTPGDVQKVLQNLLRERVSVRDLVAILEALGDHVRVTRDPDLLTEYARQVLSRSITSQYAEAEGRLYVMTLSPPLQQMLAGSLLQGERGTTINIEPVRGQRLVQQLAQMMESMAVGGHQPVLLCAGRIRLPLRRLTERSLPNLAVLSYNEVAAKTEVYTVGMVGMPNED